MSASSDSNASGWGCSSVLVVGLDSDGFVLILLLVVEDNLGEELLVTVVIVLIIVVIMLRTLADEVVAPRPLIPRFSAIEKQIKVLLSVSDWMKNHP